MIAPIASLSSRVQRLAGWLLILPILAWLWTLTHYATNVVSNDDYALLVFVARWHNPAIAWADRLADLIALHNTHRIIYDRLVCLGTYYLTGQFSVTAMIALGNLALLGIGWQLWRGFRQLALPAWYFLPVPCWLFSLQSHENMFWGMAALQNFTVIWLVQESLHQLHRRAPLVWPLLLAVAATLTSGNGLLAFPIGLLLLVSQQRRARILWMWGISTLFVGWVMLGLSSVAHERTPLPTWLPNLCLALGGALTNETSTRLPMLVGLLLLLAMSLAVLSWLTRFGRLGQQLRQQAVVPEWLAFGLFMLATALLLAMHRLPDEILRDRYKLYAHLMLSLVYLLGLAVAGTRTRLGLAVGVSLLAATLNLGAFHACLPRVVAGFQQRQADAFNFRQNHSTLPIPYMRPYMDSLLVSVDRQGLYQFPAGIAAPATWSAGSLPGDTLVLSSYQNDVVQNSFLGEHPCYLTLTYPTVDHHLANGTDSGIYVAAEDTAHHTYLFPGSPEKGSLGAFLTGKGPFRPGIRASFLSGCLRPGRYQMRLLRLANGHGHLLGAGQSLDVQSVY